MWPHFFQVHLAMTRSSALRRDKIGQKCETPWVNKTGLGWVGGWLETELLLLLLLFFLYINQMNNHHLEAKSDVFAHRHWYVTCFLLGLGG